MTPKAVSPGNADGRLAGRGGLLEVVAAERLQAGLVDEIGDRQLAELLRRRLARNGGGDQAGLADGDRCRGLLG